MGTVIENGLSARQAQLKAHIGVLAYEHLQLSRRIKEIEAELGQLEGAQVANTMTKKDLDTEAAIAAAKENSTNE